MNKSPRSLALRLRAALAPALAILLLNASLAALAQDPAQLGGAPAPAPAKSSRYVAAPSSGYIISQDEFGNTVCRLATPEEAKAMGKGRDGSLRQINHLKTNGMTSAPDKLEAAAVGLTIILRATAQLDQQPNAATVKAAFAAAAAKWEALIKDEITVVIDVDYGPNAFGTPFNNSNILGQTGTQGLYFDNNLNDIRNRLINRAAVGSQERAQVSALPTGSLPTDLGSVNTVIVQSPNLRALGGIPAHANPPTETNFGDPPRIAFNSAFGFDFDPSNGITFNQTDFDAVAVHEIGHALGFDSNVGIKEIAPDEPLRVALWDLFRFRPGTAQGSGFTNAQRVMTTGGSHVHFDGGAELPLSTGNPEGENGDNEQASHWKDNSLNGGFFVGIMDPNIPRGVREELTNNDRRAIDFFGYQTGVLAAPPNDNFANAQAISGLSGSVSGTNSGATKEPGEPTNPPDTGGGRSVWYRWTAPATGSVTMDTVGSSFDTTLAVYTGGSVSGLSVIASNDDIVLGDNVQSTVTFSAAAGTTYQIQIDGYDADIGTIVLNWSQQGSPPSSSVQFSASEVSVSEAAGSVDVTVTRTGDTPAGQSVQFFTFDVTTSGPSDYTGVSGTLFWAPGETSRNITIQLNNDSTAEPDETFRVMLQNNSGPGHHLGSPSTITVTITNDDSAPPGPNTVQFMEGSSFAATEGTHTQLNILVNRTGDVAQAASVDYATSNVTASDRSDYTAAYGTLRWAPGESAAKEVVVFIVDDSYGNTTTNGQSDSAVETFNITLSNPVGCSTGTPSQFQVSIANNETADGANPVKNASFSPQFFVWQHYLDFFNRVPDSGGLAFWMGQTTGCGASDLQVCRNNVSGAFFVSIEFQETGYFVYKMYQAAYGVRPGEPVPTTLREFLPDLQQVGRGVIIGDGGAPARLEANKVAYANAFVARDRFAALNAMSATDFIETLNNNTENSVTDAQRLDLVARLNASQITRAQALREVAQHATVNQKFFTRAFVLMQYYGYLRRNPNDAPELNLNFDGYNFWLQKLNQFGGNHITSQMVQGFITSGEYERRFGP